MKTCNNCKLSKPFSEFTKRKLAPKQNGIAGVSFKSNCKDCASAIRVYNKYKITPSEYSAMFSQQNGRCKICNLPETTVDTRYGRTRTLSVDHDHKTGKIRGLLCEQCNRALGMLKDNRLLLEKAILYLEGSL